MAPGMEIDAAKFDAEEGRLQLPAAMNNNGNLFRPLSSNVYVEEVEKLRSAGKIARSTILYDPNKTLLHLFAWTGTVTKIVFKSPFFWFLMILNVVLSIIYYTALGNSESVDFFVDAHGWPWISSFIYGFFGGLVTFMVVIHAGDCYGRFFQQYNTVRAIEVNVNAVINILRTHMPNDVFDGANELRATVARWVVAQVYLGFGWLPSYRENGVDEWTWAKVNEYGLISAADREVLMKVPVGEYPITELTTSCTQLLWQYVKAGKIGDTVAADLGGQMRDIQNNFFALYATTEQPVPFALYHYISLVNNLWLLLLAYQWIFYSYYWGIFACFLNVYAFLGLRELANNLAEPFGSDESDIPVFDFVVKWHTRVDNFIHLPVKFGEPLIARHESGMSQ
eukprot:TRINITY_DN16693_c0_g1_i1.p1 TRINITY_DN16693_c0_g1~~TRINITY_DN16693_c0_g1_i1.p1  ORF type:complete len:395 (+),score=140.09 TRINITY_DN16693_c0_g1_i1:412-1596(+)